MAIATILMISLDSGQNSVQPSIFFVSASMIAFNIPSVLPIVCTRGMEETVNLFTLKFRFFFRASSSFIPMRESGGSINTE